MGPRDEDGYLEMHVNMDASSYLISSLNDFDRIDVELTDSDSPERMTATGYKIKGTGIVLMNMTRSRGG